MNLRGARERRRGVVGPLPVSPVECWALGDWQQSVPNQLLPASACLLVQRPAARWCGRLTSYVP
jgi:hypothetical protein